MGILTFDMPDRISREFDNEKLLRSALGNLKEKNLAQAGNTKSSKSPT